MSDAEIWDEQRVGKNVMHPIQKANEEWEARAIEESRAELEALGMCAKCAMDHPCICDMDERVQRMRKYYEANRRTLFRREPVGFRSWRQPDDVLMTELYKIATGR